MAKSIVVDEKKMYSLRNVRERLHCRLPAVQR